MLFYLLVSIYVVLNLKRALFFIIIITSIFIHKNDHNSTKNNVTLSIIYLIDPCVLVCLFSPFNY